MSDPIEIKSVAPNPIVVEPIAVAPKPLRDTRSEAKPAAKKAVKPAAKTPANESAVAARAAAVTRNLGNGSSTTNLKREAAEASSVARGKTLADKFIARAAQRNS